MQSSCHANPSLRLAGVGLLVVIACVAMTSAVCAQDPAAQEQAAIRDFNATAALQNSGIYDRAAARWADFLKKYPNDKRVDRVTYYLGICQLHQKQYAEATTTFQALLNKFPQFTTADGARYNLAMSQYQTALQSQKPADYQTAAKSFADTVAKHAASRHAGDAAYFQGEALYAAGDLKGATAAYAKLIQAYPQSGMLANAYYALGTTQQDLGQDNEAAQTYQKFLGDSKFTQHSLANEVRLRLGMCQFALKNYAEAEKNFAAVAGIKDFALADFAMLRQGNCRMEVGDLAGAATIFANLVKQFPETQYRGAAQLAAGRCFYQTDKLNDAVNTLKQLLAANQVESIEAAYWLGRTYIKDNKPQEAVATLDQVIQSIQGGPLAAAINKAKAAGDASAENFVPYVEMTRIDGLYEMPDRRKETAALYEDFFNRHAAHPLGPQTLYMAALAALGEEDFGAARSRAEKFLTNQDKAYSQSELTPAVLFIAAEGYLLDEPDAAKANLSKAEQFYRQLVTKFPEHLRVPRANLRIGWCLFQADHYDQAIAHLNGVVGKLKEDQLAEARLLIGRSHAGAGRHQDAVGQYQAAVQAAPNWERADEVLLAAAQSYIALKDAQNAAQRLDQIVSKYPNSNFRAQVLYQLGEIGQEQKQYDAAIARYNEVLQKFADSEFAAPALYGIAAAYFAKDDDPKALESLNKLIAGKAEEETIQRGRYLRGLVYQRLKQFPPAVQDLQYFIASKPQGDMSHDALYALTLCQIGLNQFDPATQTLASLVAAKTDYEHLDKIYYEMGHAYLTQTKPKEAAAAFGKLVETRPESPLVPESWFHIGRSHELTADGTQDETVQGSEVAKAADAFRKGVAKAEKGELREKLQYKLGDMLFRQKDYAAAADSLLGQVNEYPQGELVGPGRFLAAECLYQQNDFEKALPLFEKVASDKVEKYIDQSLYRAGASAGTLKRWDVSQKHYEALLQQFSKFEQISEARYGLALALQNQNRADDARKIYEQVASEPGTETAAKSRFMIGEIAFGQKKYQEAIEHFFEVAVGYPYKEWQALARYEAGRCFAELGKKPQAIAQLEMVIKDHADHPKAQDAQRLVDELKKAS